jgi:hypothetical protein
MIRYLECPFCGAHLDPGERCDCVESHAVPCPEEVRRIRDRIQARAEAERQSALSAHDNTEIEIR